MNRSLVVKISDFGLACQNVEAHFLGGGLRRFPARWMAIESLMHGEFSHKTDVVCIYLAILFTWNEPSDEKRGGGGVVVKFLVTVLFLLADTKCSVCSILLPQAVSHKRDFWAFFHAVKLCDFLVRITKNLFQLFLPFTEFWSFILVSICSNQVQYQSLKGAFLEIWYGAIRPFFPFDNFNVLRSYIYLSLLCFFFVFLWFLPAAFSGSRLNVVGSHWSVFLIYLFLCVQWSFGVTLWEIFSCGAKPYADIPTGDICSHLSEEKRLPQPNACPDHV